MESNHFLFQRMIVVGATGSGKSTLAENIARVTGIKAIDMDAVYWLPNWEHVTDQEFRERLETITRQPAWILAGNYRVSRDIAWKRAELIIWLDYPLWTVFWRLWRRTWRRWWTQELLWGTNREQLWKHFMLWSAQDSLFTWLFTTYWRRKREFPLLFSQPEHSHLKIIHMHTPAETDAWLAANFRQASSG